MKKRLAPAALAVAAALLAGCGTTALPYAREMGDMALMRTMGVDTGEGGAEQLHVTVSSGRRARGLQGEAEPPLVLSAERESISSACLAMQGLSDSYVFYGHVDQLLLGEELSRRGILETLQYFSQDQELGMGTQVWIVRGGTAAEAISAEQERGVESRLSTIQTDSEMGMAGMTRTVGETLTSLMEDGSAYLPGLVPGEDGALLESGYGVVKDGMLAGWLTGEQARGLESEQDYSGDPPVCTLIVEAADETTEEEVDPQLMIAGFENSLQEQAAHGCRDVDARTAAHELYGYKAALRDLGLLEPEEVRAHICDHVCPAPQEARDQEELDRICESCERFEPPRDTFRHLDPALRGAPPVRAAYRLGLALERDCPDNDCRVYRNIFRTARELDTALDGLDEDGAPALYLRKALRERVSELKEMYTENHAVRKYRGACAGGGAL